ncbi:MAK10-like protein [Tanacetum coccineum]
MPKQFPKPHTNKTLTSHQDKILSLFKNVLIRTPNTNYLNQVSKLEYRDIWQRILKEWKGSKKAIFRQREEINDRMAEMFGLLKELTTSRTPKKVLVREEARHPITKNVNAISLVQMEEDKNIENNVVVDKNVIKLSELNAIEPNEVVDIKKEVEDGTNDEPARNVEEEITGDGIEELVEMPRSQPVGYYLKHEINEKLIEGLKGNQRYNDSLLATRLGKMDYETYNPLLVGPMYNAILKNKITKKEDKGGNFVIPCNIGGLKYIDALVNQGSDVNVMPLSIYNRQTNEKPIVTDIRLSLASHSYIYPIGIVEDILVEIVGYVYPVDYMILDIKEDKKKPFILGTSFLTTAKAEIRFDKGTITLKSGKNKVNFFKIPESPRRVEERTDNDIGPVAPTNTVSRLILEWEERIKLRQEKEMEFNQWRSKVFIDERSALVNEGYEVDDEGGIT